MIEEKPKASWLNQERIVCEICGKSVWKLGLASHMARHEREEIEKNTPKYSEVDKEQFILQGKQEFVELEKFISVLDNRYTPFHHLIKAEWKQLKSQINEEMKKNVEQTGQGKN